MKKKIKHEIYVNLKEKKDITSFYNDNTLSEDLGNYIYKECQGISLKNEITLNVITEFDINDKDKRRISDLIHSYYGLEVKEDLIYIKYSIIKNILIFIMGIIILTVAFVIKKHDVISEILIIIGWILIWEILDDFLFHKKQINLKIKRCRNLAKCRIKFNY